MTRKRIDGGGDSASSPATTEGEKIERRDREKRYLVSRSEERKLEELALDLSSKLGASVKLSNIIRALAQVAITFRTEIVEEAGKAVSLERPANVDLEAIARFEQAISEIITRAVRC